MLDGQLDHSDMLLDSKYDWHHMMGFCLHKCTHNRALTTKIKGNYIKRHEYDYENLFYI